jgi:phosphoglycerate dehydrogenase-like enzyme
MKILIVHYHRFELWHAPAWLRERLRSEFPDVRVVQLENYDRVPEEIQDTDVFIGWSLRPEQVLAAKNLKWIHSPAAAVHQLMFPELLNSKVVITNSSSVHGPVVAEHALALLLALAKRLPRAMHYQASKIWAQDLLWSERPRPQEVEGATVLVVGVGGIGGEFIKRAKALGMNLLAVRRNPEKGSAGADEVFPPSQLYGLLPRAGYVLLSTPVTPATSPLINAGLLAMIQPHAYLINVGRGTLVDEAALIRALQTRHFAGAALDVFEEEPLPEHSPLWSLDNVLITPHTAGVTEGLWERHYRLIAENLRRFREGRELLGEVDKKEGY